MVRDVNGLRVEKGDIVAPITGDFKGRVCAIKEEDGEGFVSIRASHRPYSKGVWYASDRVQRLTVAPDRREATSKLFDGATLTESGKERAKEKAKAKAEAEKRAKANGATTAASKKTSKKKVTKQKTAKKVAKKKVAKKTTKKKTTKKKTTKKKTAAK